MISSRYQFCSALILFPLSLSLSQNSWERGKSTRSSAMSNSSLQYYFWPEWQNFAQNASLIQNRPEFGMTQNMGSLAPVCPLKRKIPAIPARTKWNSKLCHNLPVLLYFYFYFFIIFSPWISNPPCFFLLFYFFPFGNLPSTNYHFAMSSYS